MLVRHGKRVLKNSRYVLDFRNPDVQAYLDQVIARLVNDYGVGCIGVPRKFCASRSETKWHRRNME